MSSSIGIAALEAEIVSRKRTANQASSMAAPLTVPKKKSKLKMKWLVVKIARMLIFKTCKKGPGAVPVVFDSEPP